MACPDYNALFTRETNRILPIFRERGRVRSWWASLGGNGLKSEPWPEEFGDTASRNILERTIPNRDSDWQPIAANSAVPSDEGTCVPSAAIVKTASTLRTTQLYQEAMDTDWLCVNDVRSALNFKRQVAHMLKNLSDNVTDWWEERNRSQYVALAQNKLVFNPDLPVKTNGTTLTDFPLELPTSTITQKYLNRLRVILQHNAAGTDGGAYGREDGGDVFAVVMSTDMQEALFTTSDRINRDRRYAEAPKLLKAYGVDRSYQGWFHIIDNKAPRFDFVNGAWVNRPFYANSATTKGNRAVVNPDYEAAEYEMVIPFLKTIVTRMIPRSFPSAGSGASFKPWNYAGTPMWVNEYDRVCNKYKTNGYWSVLMQAAYMPEKIEDGWGILCKRPCNSDLEMVTCTET
jgi:hypothetical protein